MKTKVTKSRYPFTLSDISDLLDNKLAIWSDRIRSEIKTKIDQSATGIIAEMDKRFAQVDDRFDEIDKRFTEVDKRFDRVEDKIQSLDERLIVQSERVKKVEKSTFVSP